MTLDCDLRPRQRAWLDRAVEQGDDAPLLLRISRHDQPDTYSTRNPAVIRQWARERNAQPAMLSRPNHAVAASGLDLALMGDREDGLRRIDWTEWFDVFSACGFTFFYRTHRADGVRSLYFRIAEGDGDAVPA